MHSKVQNLYYSELEIQNYLKIPGIKIVEAQNLFQLRVKMTPLVIFVLVFSAHCSMCN